MKSHQLILGVLGFFLELQGNFFLLKLHFYDDVFGDETPIFQMVRRNVE